MLACNVYRNPLKNVSIPILFVPELKIKYLNIYFDGLPNINNLNGIYVYVDRGAFCVVLDGEIGARRNSTKYLLHGAVESAPDEIFLKDLEDHFEGVYGVGNRLVLGKHTGTVFPPELFLPALANNLNACILFCGPLSYRAEKTVSQLTFVDADTYIRKPIPSAGLSSTGNLDGINRTAKKLFFSGEYRKDSAFILAARSISRDRTAFYTSSALKHLDLYLETPFPVNHPLIVDYKLDRFLFSSVNNLSSFNLLQNNYYIFYEILVTGSLFFSYCIDFLVLLLLKAGFCVIKNAGELQQFFNELVDNVCTVSGVSKDIRQLVFRVLLKAVSFLCDADANPISSSLLPIPNILTTDEYCIVSRVKDAISVEQCSYVSPNFYLVLDMDLNETPLSYDLTKYVCTVLYGKGVANTFGKGLVFVGHSL